MISVESLNVELRPFSLTDIDLQVADGEFFVLMGPTGAGKTVLLEAIAGLVPVRSGTIRIGDTEVTDLAPEKRGIAIVYQDNTLFPHLDVHDNIIYGLRYHHRERREAEGRVRELIEELEPAPILRRRTANLSGGEIQRTALARALAINPRVLLLDEPLSALDPGFRKEIQQLLARLNRSSRVTFLMVTHDFSEALALADRAAVINEGRIEQVDLVQNIFRKPASGFVAGFVGMRNIYPATYSGTEAVVGGWLRVETGMRHDEARGIIAIRPEDIVIGSGPAAATMQNSFPAVVTDVCDQGLLTEVDIEIGGITFSSLITKGSLVDLGIRPGTKVYASFEAASVHSFSEAQRGRLG